jgi:hypothetical protein
MICERTGPVGNLLRVLSLLILFEFLKDRPADPFPRHLKYVTEDKENRIRISLSASGI